MTTHPTTTPAAADPAPAAGDADVANPVRRPPADPAIPVKRWLRENLFSSWSNTAQTVAFAAVGLAILRWLTGLVFRDDTDWTAVATNIRLLMAFNYPVEQFVRVWFCVGAIFAAAGLSVGAWQLDLSTTLRRLGVRLGAAGAVSAITALVAFDRAPADILVGLVAVAAALGAAGAVLAFAVPGAHRREVGFPVLLGTVAGTIIAFVWLYPLGRFELIDGEAVSAPGTVNASTKGPWTVMMIIVVAAYAVGVAIASRRVRAATLRRALAVWWVIGPAFLMFLVLRDPAFDWGYVWTVDVPLAAGFALGGGAVLYLLCRPGAGETARAVAAVLVAVAVFNWVAGFAGWYPMLQKVRISFALLALAALVAPTFAGDRGVRLRFAAGWGGLVVVLHWLITGINTPSTLDINSGPFLGGFVLTVAIAYYVMLASFPLGIALALARTSKMPIFRVLATSYIELIRGIPLITVLFFFSIMLNLFLPRGMEVSELAAIFVGYTLFSGAYMAENIRGGLQSIRRGQYEASDALGLTTVQRTVFIVLPQALRVTIPNVVGQAIAIFKETSLIAIVGAFDILQIANKGIPSQPAFLGQTRPALLFVSVVYWVFAYSMSRASRRLETRLGVGGRL